MIENQRRFICGIAKSVVPGAVLVACSLCIFGESANPVVPFPEEYRMWVYVKSSLIGPQHPRFAVNGGIHHFYANPKAMEGYRTGKFDDNSVLVDDLLETKESEGVTTEGPRRRVAVMWKDARRFADTGGWGFEIFKGDNHSEGTLNSEGKAQCFACHQKGRDSVFSSFRK